MDIKSFIKTHQQTIVLSVGYALLALIGFYLGRITYVERKAPEIRVEESFAPLLNDTGNVAGTQSESLAPPAGATPTGVLDCSGKIKGNIGSKGERIYHKPGGMFYKRTNPEQCFESETQAQAAGFRKSSK